MRRIAGWLKGIKAAAIIGVLFVAMIVVVMPAEARFAGCYDNSCDREAVVNEAYYAVTGQGPNFLPVGSWVGRWNYMGSDVSAQSIIYGKFGSDFAGWTAAIVNNQVPYGYYENAGRGGQCFFFVDLILYRSGSIPENNLPINWDQIEASWKSIDYAKSGDVIFKPRSIGRHIAILTIRNGDYATVVESNYGFTEKITHRQTTIRDLKAAGYRVYTGVDEVVLSKPQISAKIKV